MSLDASKTPELRDERSSGLSPRWVPVAIVVIGSLWASHYVWHTNQNSYGDQDTVLFINFLIWPLLAATALVIVGALKGKNEDPHVGLSDHRRLLLMISVPIYGVGIVYGGFILASMTFLLILLPVLGVRNPCTLR